MPPQASVTELYLELVAIWAEGLRGWRMGGYYGRISSPVLPDGRWMAASPWRGNSARREYAWSCRPYRSNEYRARAASKVKKSFSADLLTKYYSVARHWSSGHDDAMTFSSKDSSLIRVLGYVRYRSANFLRRSDDFAVGSRIDNQCFSIQTEFLHRLT